jgi:hypothetical protein
MAISITTKQIGQWVVGLITAILLGSIKYSVDSYSKHNEELRNKVDKIYDYATNHEVRMKLMEDELADHNQKILDLQLAQERLGIGSVKQIQKQNNTNISPKVE